jgi:hypothetical protein
LEFRLYKNCFFNIYKASASADSLGRVWDAETGEMCKELKNHQASVKEISFDPFNFGLIALI